MHSRRGRAVPEKKRGIKGLGGNLGFSKPGGGRVKRKRNVKIGAWGQQEKNRSDLMEKK